MIRIKEENRLVTIYITVWTRPFWCQISINCIFCNKMNLFNFRGGLLSRLHGSSSPKSSPSPKHSRISDVQVSYRVICLISFGKQRINKIYITFIFLKWISDRILSWTTNKQKVVVIHLFTKISNHAKMLQKLS
jgi:hypothetical protein